MNNTLASRWQQAWEDVEPQLQDWWRSWTSSSNKPRILRVNQLDAELLDEELVQILQEPLVKALGLINVALRSKLEPELALIIRLTLYKFSIWDLGGTYGAKLQDLRYHCKRSSLGSLAPSGLPERTLAIHAFLTVLAPYFRVRLRRHALSNAWPDTPSSDRRRKAWNLMSSLESMHSAASLLSFIVFLWNGKYRTLADRILSMRLVSSRRFTDRQVSYEFMNRQMVWHAFTEFLILFLPAFGSRTFRRSYNQLALRVRNFSWNSFLRSNAKDSSEQTIRRGRFCGLPDDQCAICADNASFGFSSLTVSADTNPFSAYLASAAVLPSTSSTQDEKAGQNVDEPPTHPITTPYRASCGHVYCYVCLSEKLVIDDGDDGWTCLRCAEIVHSCERVNAICDDDSARTSDGWASEVEELASFESDMDMSLDSEPSHL